MIDRRVHAPSAYLARGIENILFIAKETENDPLHWISCLSAKAIGLVVVPVVLLGELIVEPVFLTKAWVEGAKEEWEYSIERTSKLVLGILCSPLSILAADAVSCLFLEKIFSKKDIEPFGVEKIYGIRTNQSIFYPSSVEEIQKLVTQSKSEGKQISIIGAGFSQGEQTVPSLKTSIVMDLKYLKKMEFIPGSEHGLVKVGAGSIWEEVQQFINEKGKSVIVKQASDVFSVGGSIAINCHGWEHAWGSIASTVESLEVIDAEGNLRTLSMKSPSLEDRELFRCMFGTLGYFGVIVSATLKLKDNEMYQEKGVKVPISEFDSYYKEKIQKNEKAPLLMGRLRLDGKPLQEVYFNTFELCDKKDPLKPILVTPDFKLEAARGERIARIFLNAIGHLPSFLFKPLIRFYWNGEVKTMQEGKISSRNEILHFGLKSFIQLHQSDLYTQWLQEYFISEENLPAFLAYLGTVLEENDVRLLNASIRPTPKDEISILPYAEKDCYAVVLSFHQLKTKKEIEKTKQWIQKVQKKLLDTGNKWYQAYMPFASQEEFELCYGKENVERMRDLKKKFDPEHVFSNKHTDKYFDRKNKEIA